MANYYGTGRTNTFAVKDAEALRAVLEPREFTVVDRETGPDGTVKVSIFADDSDGSGSWDSYRYNEDTDEDDELYVPDMIAEHLLDGEVAVFMHVGNEKQRYVSGYAIAVHSDGRQVTVSIDDIYDRAAQEFGLDRRIDPANY